MQRLWKLISDNWHTHKGKLLVFVGIFIVVLGYISDITGVLDYVGINPFNYRGIIEQTATSTIDPIPTTIPYGPVLVRMDFTEVGDGSCDKYDPNILGYESHQYYIQPLSTNGYIGACKLEDLGPRGSYEVRAYPKGDLAFWGYGIILGWQGGGGGTTDACMFGVQRTSGKDPVSYVIVKQRINKVEETLYYKKLAFSLDEKPHTLRIVMVTLNQAIGYFDGQFVAEFKYRDCVKGKIGLLAWGTGETKIYFDDFVMNSLP